MNTCTQWRSIYTIILRFRFRVKMVNAYLRCVDAQEGRAGAEEIEGKTG
jgi:hypothetical protein